LSDIYFNRIGEYLANGNFGQVIKGNLTNGKTAVIYWSWENGRIFQTASLFMLGMLLGRKSKFISSEENSKFWNLTLFWSIVAFVIASVFKEMEPKMINREAILVHAQLILGSLTNFAFMILLVSLFVVLFQNIATQKILNRLSPLGRMSLSNYVIQSIIGSIIYYGFGFGLYRYTGATFSLLIGIILFLIQLVFCRWWLKKHTYGPLEYIWHKATWAWSK
jgi:uncharacterized protein